MYRVLVISENKSFLEESQTYLTKFSNDMRVTTLSDVSKIEDALEENIIDAFVCDHNPPKIDAFKIFTKRYAAQDYRPFIIASKKLDEETLMMAFEEGINNCVLIQGTPMVYFLNLSKKLIFHIEKYKAELNNKLNNRRLKALVKLSKMYNSDSKEIMHYALEESIVLTKSDIGYLALYNKETNELEMQTWSQRVMSQSKMPNKPMKYFMPKTGLWGEPVRLKQNIIINDYNKDPIPGKKGTPEGHPKLNRLIMIPLMYNGEVVGTAGVANKQDDYDEADMNQFILMMEGFINIYISKKQSEEKASMEHKLRNVLMNAPVGVLFLDGEFNVLDCSEYMKELLDFNSITPDNKFLPNGYLAESIFDNIENNTDETIIDNVFNDTKSAKKYRVRILISVDNGKKFCFVIAEDYTQMAILSEMVERNVYARKTFNDMVAMSLKTNVIAARNYIKYITDGSVREHFFALFKRIEYESTIMKEQSAIGMLENEWINLEELATIWTKNFSSSYEFKVKLSNIRIHCDYNFRKVFIYLIEDSLKRGGTTKVSIYYKVSKGNLYIYYEDDGNQIPNEEVDDIFSEEPNVSRAGMFIVREVIAASGFQIRLSSNSPKGKQYEITVPVEKYEIG